MFTLLKYRDIKNVKEISFLEITMQDKFTLLHVMLPSSESQEDSSEWYARVKPRARMQINGASRGLSTARRVRPIGRNFLDEPIARHALRNRQ